MRRSTRPKSYWRCELARLAREESGQFGFGLGDISDGVAGFLDSFLADLLDALYYAVVYAFQILQYLFSLLQAVADFLYNALVQVLNWIKAAAQWFWSNVLTKIVQWIQQARQVLHKIFGPILDVLKKLHQLQQWYYENILKPVLTFIQRLRGVLLIFRLLHFKFAQTLDSYLTKQEAKIAGAFLQITQELNTLIGWVNWLSDPFGLISTNVYLWTAARSINDLWAMIHDIQAGTLTQPQKLTDSQQAGFFTWGNLKGVMSRPPQSGLTPVEQQAKDAVQQGFLDMGYSLT